MSQFIEMFSKYPSETPWHKLLNIINGKAYPEEYNNIGSYPICGSAGIMYYGERKLCDANTIILGRKGNINHPIYMESDYWIVDTAFCLDVNKSILHPKYFYYWCCQYDFTKLNKQGVLPSLTRKDLEKIEMSIPPMAEQKKFVSIVEQADKSKFGDFKSQFIEMFSSYQTTPVGNYIEDSYPGEWGTEDKDGNGIKVIRTTNFTNSGKLDLTDVITRSILEKKIERKVIRKYDTILERSGGTADNPVGRVVLFEEDEQYLCNNFTQVLRFKKVDPIFAFYSLFYFYQTNKMVVSSMGSKTTGIQNLNMSRYLEIGIPNASDNEQKKFVVIAKQADKSKSYVWIALKNLESMLGYYIRQVA